MLTICNLLWVKSSFFHNSHLEIFDSFCLDHSLPSNIMFIFNFFHKHSGLVCTWTSLLFFHLDVGLQKMTKGPKATKSMANMIWKQFCKSIWCITYKQSHSFNSYVMYFQVLFQSNPNTFVYKICHIGPIILSQGSHQTLNPLLLTTNISYYHIPLFMTNKKIKWIH